MVDKKPKFKSVDPRPDFVAMEKKLLAWWYEAGIVDRYLQKNKDSAKLFSFLDGPITANNPMGVHHAWGRTYKDLWQRFYNMRGYKQRFQNGFDAQGLWVEVQVEKDLGLKSKKDIENLVPGDFAASIAKFVKLCKDRVYKFAKLQTEQSKRLGYFMDWENSYYTLSDENNYMIWHFLKKCHEKGLIYKGRDSVAWCPRCGTAISQHEMLTENYREVTHESIFVKYPIIGEDFSLLVWTTTPWTLPANVAVAINPDANYEVWEWKGDKVLIGGEDAWHRLWEFVKGKHRSTEDFRGATKNRHFKGSDLLKFQYLSPFDHLPRVKQAMGGQLHKVVAADPLILTISEEEGTGLVHIAPGAGTEDFQLGKKLGLPVIDVIDEEAAYLDGLAKFSAKNAKESPEIILDFLREEEDGKYLFDVASFTHRYPVCWRCNTELVWRVVDEWYIAMDPLREPMKEVARKIHWIPEFGLKRELDWLENMHDWLISKKRYWGLALPIWECASCGDFEVIGGKEELKEKAVEGWNEFEGNSPHRPWVDKVRIKCQKCGKLTERIPDVGNPWLDAGIVPFSTVKSQNRGEPLYWRDRKGWKSWYPADFITESFPGQFKGWFYSLIAMSAVLEGQEPFKTVLGFATLFGEDGRPMHKSSGNMIEFGEGADKIGVDVMRWVYARQDPSQNLLFGYKLADQTRRDFYLMLWNIYNFFVTYANLDGWQPGKKGKKRKNVLDSWILSRLNGTVAHVTDSLSVYDARGAAAQLEEFVHDLSIWYVRRSRDRIGPGVPDCVDKDDCHTILWQVLTTLSKLLAPAAPFIAEEIYKNLKLAEESVHLTDWPCADRSLVDKKLEENMAVAREAASAGNAARKAASIPIRQPLGQILVVHSNKQLEKGLVQLIKDELNVKRVQWRVDKNAKEVQVTLDTTVTPELEEEGKARGLARKIQEERKKLGVSLDEEVSVVAPWLPGTAELLKWLKRRTLSGELKTGSAFRVERTS